MTKPDVYVDLHLVLLQDDRVLLGIRKNTNFGAGQYHLPAGHLEPNESITDGMIREVWEETGLTLSPEDLALAYVLHFRGESDRLSLFFNTKQWSGEIQNREPDKCEGWEWVPVNALPDNTIPYAKYAITQLLQGMTFGLFGWPDNAAS